MIFASAVHFLLGVFFSPCLSKCVLAELYTFHYPTSGKVNQQRPQFLDRRRPDPYPPSEYYPPCTFNSQCSCSSNTPYDLGIVFCENVELGRVPLILNSSKVHTLTLRSNKLRHLDERSFYGSGLWRLEIRHNDLFRIPEKAFLGIGRSLSELDLRYNELSRMPREAMQGLRKLKLLDLTGNHITTLTAEDFEGFNRYLIRLVMASNSLVEIPDEAFRTLSSLRELDLQDNNIRSIRNRAFEGSSSTLTRINLANNLLSNIPFTAFSYLRQLQHVNLARNLISQPYDVMFIGVLSLDTLILDFNAIEYLPPHSFQNFESVNTSSFRGNPLQKIGADAFKGSKIRELYLQDCDIWNLSEKSFRGIEETLQTLDLSYNNLTDIPENIFDRIDSLKWLSLAHNRLILDPKKSFNGFTYTLQYLNMLGNQMHRMPDELFRDSPVEILKLSKNLFTGVPDHSLHHITETLKVLDLSSNSLTNVSDAVIGDLENLIAFDISHNKIHHIGYRSFHALWKLTALDVSNNPVKDINMYTFDGLQDSLQNLSIANTSIESFPELQHPNLAVLNASSNVLSFLPTNTMANLSGIRVLDVSHNELTSPGSNAWQVMPFLRDVRLQGNFVRSITNSTFASLSRLEVIDIRDFPLHVFQVGSLAPLKCLRTLIIDTQPNVPRFNLGAALSKVPSLQDLTLQTDNSLGSELRGGALPYRLSNITLIGHRMKDIAPRALEMLTSRQLRLTFLRTGLQVIPHDLFANLGRVRFLALGAYNNSLTGMGEPYTTVTYPGARGSIFLTDLSMHHNKWACNCGIGWLEKWLKVWRSSVCVGDGDLLSYLNCQKTVRQLRQTQCADRPKSIMESLKHDLECGVSGAPSSTNAEASLVVQLWSLMAIAWKLLESRASSCRG
ncbi:Leucine rich repeat 5 [Trinorchestia longiramus]|nr:Leucine rich repeat 5 [Trinorchestia longiramus]